MSRGHAACHLGDEGSLVRNAPNGTAGTRPVRRGAVRHSETHAPRRSGAVATRHGVFRNWLMNTTHTGLGSCDSATT